MDVIELVLLLGFVLLPLLQFVLERLRGGGREEPPPEVEKAEPPKPRAPAQVPPSVEEEAWSAGWGHWPAETLEDLAAEEVVTESEADEIIALQDRLPDRKVPEAARVTVPVVSMEQLRVDRAEERRRFREQVAGKVPTIRRAPATELERLLARPSDLRRAIVLAEVLGEPRGLRPLDTSQRG